MTAKQIVYAVLALAGLVATWTFNLQLMGAGGGFDLGAFAAGLA
jgi:hypothetical protein